LSYIPSAFQVSLILTRSHGDVKGQGLSAVRFHG